MRSWTRRIRSSLVVVFVALGLPLAATPAQAGGGCHEGATEDSASVVVLAGACFGPTITRVPVGTKVTWINKDPMAHVVVGQGYRWGSTSDLLQGDRFSTVFRASGVYPYQCYIHPGMNGAVVVGGADAPALDSLGTDPVSDAGITRNAPAPKTGTGGQVLASRRAPADSSAGLWPLATAVGFALAVVNGAALILQRRRKAAPGEVD